MQQSDRPTSQYWSTGSIASHSDLAKELGVSISHMTEQAMHNKDTADGEFSRVKTRLAMHIKRHPEEQLGHIGVHDSESFQRFGAQQLSTPGRKAKLEKRIFIDLKPEEVLQRKRDVGEVGTLPGIKSRYEYICQPDGQVYEGNYPIK